MADLAQHDSAHQAPLSAYGLALQQFDWGHPNELQTQWLVSQGVSFNSLIQPWLIGAARVTFNDGHFDPDTKGVSALTFVCFDRGDPIDIAAWQPKTGETATYLGRAVFLGDEDDVYNPATWFDGSDLRVHATPLEWLQHDRQGVASFSMSVEQARSCETPRASSAPTMRLRPGFTSSRGQKPNSKYSSNKRSA